jgi:hypothetical protein
VKCFKHGTEAVAVCPYCGRALCAQCAPPSVSSAQRIVCSAECGAALARNEQALQLLLRKSQQSARASSVYYYLCGAVAAGAALASWYWAPVPLLIWFLTGSAVALIVSGFWFGRAAGSDQSEETQRR